ncbi:MAG: LUD domain-containing protein [Chloroflexota bacterium]
MSGTVAPFKERLKQALASSTVPVALGRALPAFRERRLAAIGDDDFGAIQKQLYALKADAIERLPELIKQFTQRAQEVGTVVHRAKTAEDACRIVGDIARRHNVTLAVKSKSMVSEEVEINHYLERMGVRAVETDLGEWIIQLAHERPSHLIAPAIHKTREEIAVLFSEHTGREIPAELDALVKVAREQLRQDFVNAGMGISGANIAIAETGGIVIVSNEGNGRLCTTLPPVHVAMVGIEKIVPSMDDAMSILKILSRNATGQRQTSYVSFITGPSRSADIELALAVGVHGPVEQHIILLDNGRMAAREDPLYREALHCIKCGACSNVCPPYQEVGGHAFGHIYTGPIGLVVTDMHHGIDAAGGPQSLCMSCNACEQVCPVGIPIAQQIIDVRQKHVAEHGLPLTKQAVITGLTSEIAQTIGRFAQKPFMGTDGMIRKLPFMSALTEWRSLPGLAARPLRDRLRHLVPGSSRAGAPASASRMTSNVTGQRVAYFPGCMTDRLHPETGEAAVRVLQSLGCDVSLPLGWRCCGLVASNAGDLPTAIDLAHETIRALEKSDAEVIVSTSTSCAAMMLQDYDHIFAEDPEWHARAKKLAERVRTFTEYVGTDAGLEDGALAQGASERLTYHDACQSHNCLGLKSESRKLLNGVMGAELCEMTDSTVCCGFGGTFSVEHPEVSRRVLAKKLEHALATGASTIVADNPGCVMHMQGALDAAGSAVRVKHLADVLDEAIQSR